MSRENANVLLALSGLEAWRRGDTEAVLGALDPAVEIHAPQEVGNTGTFRGVAGYRKWEGLWMEAWEDFQNEILRAEPVGQRHVVVDAHQRGTSRGSGVEVDREVSMLCEIRDGRRMRFHIYSTHERALAAAREGDSLTPL
jgi:ketosteroid isomerase-like protein